VVGGVLSAAAMSDFLDPVVLQMLRERLSRLRGRRQRRDVAAAARRHREAVAAEALAGREQPWERPAETKEERDKREERQKNSTAFDHWKTREHIAADGTGYVTYRRGSGPSATVFMYPGMDASSWERFDPFFYGQGKDLRGANFARVRFTGVDFSRSDLRGANLDEVIVPSWSTFRMEDANLQGASLRHVNLVGGSLDGSELTGADVTGAKLPNDLRNVRLSPDQFDSLANKNSYILAEVSPRDLQARLGVGDDDFAVMMWGGDIDIRDRVTNERVSGEFNPEEHFLPDWT
jgi:hypothetical protein